MIEGVLAALAGAVAWGFSGTCVQFLFGSTNIDAVTLTTLRQLGAGLLFLVVLVARDRSRLKAMLCDQDTLGRLAIFGVAGLFLNSVLYAATISYTNAGTATVLQSLNIVFALVVTCFLARRKPFGRELAALACAMLAVFLIATHGDPTSLKMPLAGLLLGLATAAAATFYTMYPKPLFERWGSFAVTGLGLLVGGLFGLLACAVTGRLGAAFPVLDAPSLGVLGIAIVVGTFGAYGLYLHGVSIVGAVRGNMLGAAEPVSATVISALWLGTAFFWADWAGLALMVATIVLIARQAASNPDKRGVSLVVPTGH